MSRVSKSLKNAKVGAFFFIASIFVQFFTRKVFLDNLGDEFIGLTSALRSILGFLNLAELGIGTAIGYALYKPIFDKNHDEINKIIALLGILYKRIGLFIFGAGIIVAIFLPFFFDDTSFSIGLIYFVFFSFLSSTLLTYFVNYHMTLLEADQKGYVVQVYFQTLNILRLFIQAAIAYYLKDLYLWILMEVIFSVFLSIVLRYKVKQHYPWLIIKINEKADIIKKYPDIIKKTKQLFIHKMGSFVKDGTDNILVYALVSLESVTFFGNYQLIFMKLIGLIKITFSGIGAGVGNLVAENNKSQIKKVFWEMMGLQFFIGGFFSLAIYYLISPFITLWIGDRYILDDVIIYLMIGNFFISVIRSPVQYFQNAYGLFSDTWAPFTEIMLNLIVSIIFGKLYGIAGIMLGTFSSLAVIVLIWKPYFLYKRGFKINIWEYWKGFLLLTFVLLLSTALIHFTVTNYLTINISSYLNWCFSAFKISILIATVYGALLYVFSNGFRNICLRFKILVLSKIKMK